MQPRPMAVTWKGPSFRMGRVITRSTHRELPLKVVQQFVARQDLCDAGVGLATLANGSKEFAVLQLDAVHRDVDLRNINLLLLPGHEVVIECDIRARVPDIAKEGSERSVVVEGKGQRADHATRGL